MPFLLRAAITNFLKLRDELTLNNIRWRKLWPVVLVLPLTVIVSALRHIDIQIQALGMESYELMLFPQGLGCLAVAFLPKRSIRITLRIAAVCSLALVPFQLLLTGDTARLASFLAFHFFSGVCTGTAHYIFIFKLNNIERLFGLSLLIFYYGLLYTVFRSFPVIQFAIETWVIVFLVAAYVAVVFLATRKGAASNGAASSVDNADNEQGRSGSASSGAAFVIGLSIVYYMLMSTINYIEWMESSVISLPYGFGHFASIIFILLFQLFFNRSALHIWLMCLAFMLLGLGILNYDADIPRKLGSFVYGLGDGIGYIIIFYLCAGAIKKSGSIKMFRLHCVVFFINYCVISGLYSRIFNLHEGTNHSLAFGIVIVLCAGCFMVMPILQKKIFEADWTDGIHLKEIAEYAQPLAETEAVNVKDGIDLTEREQEIFALLLKGVSPKEIGYILKVSYHTVGFHRKNLYRKLGIQSIHELITKYGKAVS